MPGDALYGLKRSQETAQLQLSGSSAGKGQLYLAFAGKRLAEAQSDTGDPNGLNQLITEMSSDTLQGSGLLFRAALASHDKAALQTVTSFYTHQKYQLGLLMTQLRRGTDAYGAVLKYDTDLDMISGRSQEINAALACPTVVQGKRDRWGPTVDACGSGPSAGAGNGASAPSTGPAAGAPSGSSTGNNDATNGASTPAKIGAGAASLVPRQTSGGVLNQIQHALGGLLG
jgi:hypothetical protein